MACNPTIGAYIQYETTWLMELYHYKATLRLFFSFLGFSFCFQFYTLFEHRDSNSSRKVWDLNQHHWGQDITNKHVQLQTERQTDRFEKNMLHEIMHDHYFSFYDMQMYWYTFGKQSSQPLADLIINLHVPTYNATRNNWNKTTFYFS